MTSVFVVDDDSRDGTAEWLENYRLGDAKFDFLIRKSARGLGSATVAGFLMAIRRGTEWAATMDADGSHDPGILREMMDQMQADARSGVDVCIGSRYIAGGQVEGWTLTRLVASRVVNSISRWLIGLRPHDNTSALRLYRVAALREIDVNSIRNRGYGYLQEILFRLQEQGCTFREFPITFRNRALGRSKVTLSVVFTVILGLLRLTLLRCRRLISV